MTLTIPTERLGNVALDERDAVVDIAIGLYKRRTVSLGRAAEVAGLSAPEFLSELGRRRIPINYGIEELHEDLDTLHEPICQSLVPRLQRSRPHPGPLPRGEGE